MSTVNTVLGLVEASDLGFTLSHEHVLLSAAGMSQTYPGFIDHRAVAAEGIVELKAAFDEGVRTIVDVTTFDLGRDIGLLEEVSRGSGVHMYISSPAPATIWPSLGTLPRQHPAPSLPISSGRFRRASRTAASKPES